MEGLTSVNWSELLSPESDIPPDVTFKIGTKVVSNNQKNYIEKNENGVQAPKKMKIAVTSEKSPSPRNFSNFLPAHKLLLASVSPVFKRQFYGSFPEEEVVDIKDSSEKSFQIMIDYIYQKTGEEGVDVLVDVRELLDIFYLAEKYEVLGFKQEILNRLHTMPTDPNDFGTIVDCLLDYSHFEDACEVLKSHIINLIKHHDNPLELVKGAIDSKNYDIKQEVLTKLVSVGNILETVKAANDIVTSEDCKLDIKPVMTSCVKGYEAVHRDPLVFSKFIPEPDSHLKEAFSLLLQYVKNNFCENCGSAACKKGERVEISEAKVGSHVLVDFFQKGIISEVGLIMVDKTYIGDTNSSDCGKRLDFCNVCLMMGDLSGNPCSGVHRHSEHLEGTMMCFKISFDSGEVIYHECESWIVFDCDYELSNPLSS